MPEVASVFWQVLIIPLALALVLAALIAGRRMVWPSDRAEKVRQAQNSALDIIRQNTDALRAIERALDNNSDALKRLSREKEE